MTSFIFTISATLIISPMTNNKNSTLALRKDYLTSECRGCVGTGNVPSANAQAGVGQSLAARSVAAPAIALCVVAKTEYRFRALELRNNCCKAIGGQMRAELMHLAF